jgi:hypothetical protein
VDAVEDFEWGVWVSLSQANYLRMLDRYETSDREEEPPYFGWLSTRIPVYEPSTLNLKTRVRTQPVGTRPLVEVEPSDHPLAVDQRDGIMVERVREIASTLHHREG